MIMVSTSTRAAAARGFARIGDLPRMMMSSDNDYLRDIGTQQRGESFTGIPNFAMQDTAVQESQGRIAGRSREQPVSSDYGIVSTRKALLAAVAANREGLTVPGLEPAAQNLKAASILTAEENLEDVPLDLFEWEPAI